MAAHVPEKNMIFFFKKKNPDSVNSNLHGYQHVA